MPGRRGSRSSSSSRARTEKRFSGNRDPLSVPTKDLARILQDWIEKHDARFPSEVGDQAASLAREPTRYSAGYSKGAYGFSARNYICEQAGIQLRSLHRVLRCESKFTSLSLADELLTAIERRDALDLDLRVVPNPAWSQERWVREMKKRGCV